MPVPSQDKLGGLRQWDDGGRGTNSLGGVTSRWIVGASAYVIFPCTIRSRRWSAIMEEVDKGCSEFCIIVSTVTRTAAMVG